MFYDTLALIGIWFVAGGIAVGLEHGVAGPADSCATDGSLNCHGYGSSVTVTATFGMVAAGEALAQLMACGTAAQR
jgi:tRNA A37 threonylcarbamoyladenosine dehydratase